MRKLCQALLGLAIAACLASAAPAAAQVAYPDSSSPSLAVGTMVVKCVNSAGQAVLCPPFAGSLAAASGNVANATASATLAGAAGQLTYISGFEITAGGATAAACVSATVTGTFGGTLTYSFCAPQGVAVAATPLVVPFNPPLPASGLGTGITVSLPALGAGNTNAAVVAHGSRQ
jgi:hypothetical protein